MIFCTIRALWSGCSTRSLDRSQAHHAHGDGFQWLPKRPWTAATLQLFLRNSCACDLQLSGQRGVAGHVEFNSNQPVWAGERWEKRRYESTGQNKHQISPFQILLCLLAFSIQSTQKFSSWILFVFTFSRWVRESTNLLSRPHAASECYHQDILSTWQRKCSTFLFELQEALEQNSTFNPFFFKSIISLSEETFTPHVRWAQRASIIYLKFDIIDATNTKVSLKSNSLELSADGGNDRHYSITMEFFAEVKSEVWTMIENCLT